MAKRRIKPETKSQVPAPSKNPGLAWFETLPSFRQNEIDTEIKSYLDIAWPPFEVRAKVEERKTRRTPHVRFSWGLMRPHPVIGLDYAYVMADRMAAYMREKGYRDATVAPSAERTQSLVIQWDPTPPKAEAPTTDVDTFEASVT